MAIEQAGQHPVTVFTTGMSYQKPDANGAYPLENGLAVDAQGNAIDRTVKGTQLVPYAFLSKAITDIRKDMTFQQTATTKAQPLHSGKTMKMYRYMPVIDDRNTTDQGIDANGIVQSANDETGTGNLWGSSRDPGKVAEKMPWGREGGGRINRIGFTRKEVKSELKKIQFFWEYTEDDMMFDSDTELYKHITELSVEAANTIIENLIQLDLKAHAGETMFGGDATSINEIGANDVMDYNLFNKMNEYANKNYIPTSTTIISGSTKTDTRVIPNARAVYAPDELTADFEKIKDYHNNQAFVGVEHYAAAGNVMNGEIGKVGRFRILSVVDMQLGAAGAAAEAGVRKTKDGANVQTYPLILVGADSYNAVTLHNGGRQGKKFSWRVISKKPGAQVADQHDPYGENGFYSTRTWYGFLPIRPERILVSYVACSE